MFNIYRWQTGPPNVAAGFVTQTRFHTYLQYLSVFHCCIDIGSIYQWRAVEGHLFRSFKWSMVIDINKYEVILRYVFQPYRPGLGLNVYFHIQKHAGGLRPGGEQPPPLSSSQHRSQVWTLCPGTQCLIRIRGVMDPRGETGFKQAAATPAHDWL